MVDPLKDLPRLSDEAMGPCIGCGQQLLTTGLPIFTRITLQSCGIDAQAVRQHVGLAMQLGGGRDGLALASVMGPGRKPVIVMGELPAVNVCVMCAQRTDLSVFELIAKATEAGDDSDG
jgi:hypothetical protein